MTAASPFLHLPVAPYQRAHSRVPVLRRAPARAFGVTSSAEALIALAETMGTAPMGFSRALERLALQGWPLLSGSLFHRVRSCRQAVPGRVCAFLRVVPPIDLTGCR